MINLKLQSDELIELTKARIKFNILMESEELIKDTKGGRGKYVTIEQLQDATKPLLSQVGLTMEQTSICDNNAEYLVTTLYHESGQFVRSVGYLYKEVEGMDAEMAQEYGKIMTYKQRYQWRSLLCLGRGSEDAESKTVENKNYEQKEGCISKSQSYELYSLMKDHKDIQSQVFDFYKINNTINLPLEKFEEAKKVIQAKISKK